LLLIPSLILVACLFPVAVYALVLGLINRRQSPLLVHGSWDFAGVVFAASGFLVLGGPALLSTLNERWRMLWLLGDHRALPELEGGSWLVWTGLSALYFVGVVAGTWALLWRRRHTTSVYNVEPAVFEDVLQQVLRGLGLTWTRMGNHLFVRTADDPVAVKTRYLGPALPGDSAMLQIDPFPAMRHVSLRWEGEDRGLRRQVETELARALAEVYTTVNPASGWLLSLSALLFFVMLGVMTLLLVLLLAGRR
jgi:hypothetical protein